ncbi:hypothetical protein STBA_11740 [Streptomyces sp. MP131-18]|nr:hypothetical protein STBA_11740 [Streptomyces sp. MP131-18]
MSFCGKSATLTELPASGSVIVDAGTTTARLAAVLPVECPLTVVTHALPVAARLADHPGIASPGSRPSTSV